VIVIYGIGGDRLEWRSPGAIRRILELRATREAVLLPIQDRVIAEQTLDAFTQLSQGRLSRENAEHTVHYAWLEGGLLEWAFILDDTHLLFVDSAAAFDQAMIYERRGGSLSDELTPLAPLMKGRHRSGIYLDTAILADILAQSGDSRIARWLEPFEFLRVLGDPRSEPPSIRLELRVAAP